MLIEQVDAVRAEALEHAVDGQLDMAGAAVDSWAPLTGLKIDVEAELGCDHHPISERRDALAENALDLMRAVRLGRIEEGDAPVERSPDDVEHLGSARDRRLVG